MMLNKLTELYYWSIIISSAIVGGLIGVGYGELGMIGGAITGAFLGWMVATWLKPYLPITIIVMAVALTAYFIQWLSSESTSGSIGITALSVNSEQLIFSTIDNLNARLGIAVATIFFALLIGSHTRYSLNDLLAVIPLGMGAVSIVFWLIAPFLYNPPSWWLQVSIIPLGAMIFFHWTAKKFHVNKDGINFLIISYMIFLLVITIAQTLRLFGII